MTQKAKGLSIFSTGLVSVGFSKDLFLTICYKVSSIESFMNVRTVAEGNRWTASHRSESNYCSYSVLGYIRPLGVLVVCQVYCKSEASIAGTLVACPCKH